MIKRETMDKIKRVEGRLARGERVKPALKAEHIAQATWYSPRVRRLRHASAVVGGRQAGSSETTAVTPEPPKTFGQLPENLQQEIQKLRNAKAMLAKRLVEELLSE